MITRLLSFFILEPPTNNSLKPSWATLYLIDLLGSERQKQWAPERRVLSRPGVNSLMLPAIERIQNEIDDPAIHCLIFIGFLFITLWIWLSDPEVQTNRCYEE